MKKILLIVALAASFSVKGEDPKYPVATIPEPLLKGVNVVHRDHQVKFTILSKNHAVKTIHRAVTIMNANGKREAIEVVNYDKLSKVVSFKGAAYDATGKQIKKLKPSEIYDQSAFDGFSLLSDSRFKYADLSQGSYPYTVEYEYEVEFKFLYSTPDYYLVADEKESLEHGDFELIFPQELKPRYKAYNVDTKPTEQKMKDGATSLRWSFANILPIKYEPYSDPYEVMRRIVTTPSVFEYDGYPGSMESWESFGRWIQSLNKNRDVLPAATVTKIKALTANAKSVEEKTKILYEYMQKKTRYVSIQLGIGGLQPFEASVVDQTGYGDCKALSNYIVAMLKEVGVKANYTLVYGGDDPDEIDESFMSDPFNHVIVSVPNGKDTLWLECTSQTNPFGYQGVFTGNRKALMITDDGAKLVKTIHYSADDNKLSRSADVFIDAAGNAKASVETRYSGMRYDDGGLSFILNGQFDKQKEWLEQAIQIPVFNLGTFSFQDIRNKIPTVVVKADLSLNRFASVSGKRLFVTPNLMNRWNFIPEKLAERKTGIRVSKAFTDIDTIQYHVPAGIYPEYIPEPIKLKSRFGEYEASFQMHEEKLVYIRKFRINDGNFPASSYQEFSDFLKGVSKGDATKVVFLNKT